MAKKHCGDLNLFIGDQQYQETCGDGDFGNFLVVKWWKWHKFIGEMVIQDPPLNHHITNIFVLFSPFHHPKIAKITITTSFLIWLITNNKDSNHHDFLKPFLSKNELKSIYILTIYIEVQNMPLYFIGIFIWSIKLSGQMKWLTSLESPYH